MSLNKENMLKKLEHWRPEGWPEIVPIFFDGVEVDEIHIHFKSDGHNLRHPIGYRRNGMKFYPHWQRDAFYARTIEEIENAKWEYFTDFVRWNQGLRIANPVIKFVAHSKKNFLYLQHHLADGQEEDEAYPLSGIYVVEFKKRGSMFP